MEIQLFKFLKSSTYEELVKENHELASELLMFQLREQEYEDCRNRYKTGIGNYLNAEYINLLKNNIFIKKCKEIFIYITVEYTNTYVESIKIKNNSNSDSLWYGLIVTDGLNEIIKATILTDNDNGVHSKHATNQRKKNLLLTTYIGEYIKFCLDSEEHLLSSLKKVSVIEDIRVSKGLFYSEKDKDNIDILE